MAFERCLKEMGFSSFEAWKHDLDLIMEEVLHDHGLERTVMGNQEKHQESKQFHRQQRIIKETRDLESKKIGMEEKVRDLAEDIAKAEAESQTLKIQQELAEKQAAEQAEQIRIQQEQAQMQLQKGQKALAEKEEQMKAAMDRNVALAKKNDQLTKQNEELQQSIEDKKMQYNMLENYAAYVQENVLANESLDKGEEIIKALADEAKPFRRSAAETLIKVILEKLEELRSTIEACLQRMRFYEYENKVDEKLSEPVQARKMSLDAMIASASQKAQEGAEKTRGRSVSHKER